MAKSKKETTGAAYAPLDQVVLKTRGAEARPVTVTTPSTPIIGFPRYTFENAQGKRLSIVAVKDESGDVYFVNENRLIIEDLETPSDTPAVKAPRKGKPVAGFSDASLRLLGRMMTEDIG
jgi:hypothetical protein